MDGEDSTHNELTDKQAAFLEAVIALGSGTIREVCDEMENATFRSERVSDDEGRGLAERLEAKGELVQYTGSVGDQRYRPAE